MGKHIPICENVYCIDGPHFKPVTPEQTHLIICGIDFLIDTRVYVTDLLRKSLENSARNRISTPVLVSAHDGRLSFFPAAPDEAEAVLPEHRMKVVVNGIETELLATTKDDTPTPALTQEHIECAKRSFWLRDGYVTWAANEYEQMADSTQLIIRYQ